MFDCNDLYYPTSCYMHEDYTYVRYHKREDEDHTVEEEKDDQIAGDVAILLSWQRTCMWSSYLDYVYTFMCTRYQGHGISSAEADEEAGESEHEV